MRFIPAVGKMSTEGILGRGILLERSCQDLSHASTRCLAYPKGNAPFGPPPEVVQLCSTLAKGRHRMDTPTHPPTSSRQNATAQKAAEALAPDDERKPQSPEELEKPTWKYALKRSLHEFSRDRCIDLAAGLTFFSVLALFPALLAMLSLLGVVGQSEKTSQTILAILDGVASEQVVETLRGPVEQLAVAPSAGVALIIGVIGAVWSASGYVRAFGRSMNQIYGVQEGRPFYKLNPVMFLVTLLLLLSTVIMALLLVVSGPLARAIGDAVNLGESAVAIWSIAKWPILVAFAIVLIAVLYYATPNIKQPRFRWMSIGAFAALLLLAAASLGFFFYVSNFSNYNKTYGAIGGVIVLLLWLWIANISLLFGAEIDAELERGRELQGGIKAEEGIQLPPRDTAASDKQAAKADHDVTEGRALRHQSGGSSVAEVAGDTDPPAETNKNRDRND